MAVTATRTDAKKLRGVLNPDWQKMPKEDLPGLDDVCHEVLQAALQILEDKAKYVTVGAVAYTKEDGTLGRIDPKAEKVCVGFFSTEKQADSAAAELFGKPSVPVQCRTMIYPIHKGTPASWRKGYQERWKAERDAMLPATQGERLSALVSEGWASTPRCDFWTPDGPCRRPEGHPGSHLHSFNDNQLQEEQE